MPIVHFVKSFCTAGLTVWSVHVLSGDIGLSLLLALVPLVFGLLDLLVGPAFTFAGLAFVLAIGSVAAPRLGLGGEVAQLSAALQHALAQIRAEP